MKALLKEPVIFDGRNLFAPSQMKQHGFTYYSIGRLLTSPAPGGLMSRLKGVLTNPLLTVVMPVYNELATVEEVVRRVLALPLRVQLVVVDDCSTDGTGDLLARLRDELRFTLVRQPQEPGQGRRPARRLCRMCRATWWSSRTPTSSTRRRSCRA